MEHDRWMAMKIEDGWRWARKTDKPLKLHQDLLPWRAFTAEERIARYAEAGAQALGPGTLSPSAKEKDRALVRDVPKILAAAGYTVVKLGS